MLKVLAKRLSALARSHDVLANLIESGVYARHVRRMHRENEPKPAARLDAVTRCLPKDAQIVGTADGVHAVLWLPVREVSEEQVLITAAREAGVGTSPRSTLFFGPASQQQ